MVIVGEGYMYAYTQAFFLNMGSEYQTQVLEFASKAFNLL